MQNAEPPQNLLIVNRAGEPVALPAVFVFEALEPLVCEHLIGTPRLKLPVVLVVPPHGNAWIYGYVDDEHSLRMPVSAQVLRLLECGERFEQTTEVLRSRVLDLAANLKSRERAPIQYFRTATRSLPALKPKRFFDFLRRKQTPPS